MNLMLRPAIVTATYPETRTLDVRWLGMEGTKRGIIVTNDSGSYSFPQVGDAGLVIGDGVYYYYIGKVEYGFQDKTAGKVEDAFGNVLRPKVTYDGEAYFTNLISKISVLLRNSGNFSIANAFQDGLTYLKSFRFLKLGGRAVHVLGDEVKAAFGAVIRDLPGKGDTYIPSDAGPTVPAVEGMIDVVANMLRVARVHVGHITTALGIPEFGSWPPARLRALIEVCSPTGTPIAVLKMDESGNIELSSTIGKTMLDGLAVQLGGIAAAHPVTLADLLVIAFNSHTHMTSMGISNTPSVPVTIADFGSTKVFSS